MSAGKPRTRECGSCTMCCKSMGVPDMPGGVKPPGVWCKACDKGVGCTIYPQRPPTCRTFECVWLQDTEGLMGDDMRPDRLKVVFTPTLDGCGLHAHVDAGRPDAWQDARVIGLLQSCARAGYVAVICIVGRNEYYAVTPTHVYRVPPRDVFDDGGEIKIHVPGATARRINLQKGTGAA